VSRYDIVRFCVLLYRFHFETAFCLVSLLNIELSVHSYSIAVPPAQNTPTYRIGGNHAESMRTDLLRGYASVLNRGIKENLGRSRPTGTMLEQLTFLSSTSKALHIHFVI
jgi:hypothetical protein